MVKDFGHQLGSPQAHQLARATRDLGEYLFDPEAGFIAKLQAQLADAPRARIAYHPPCTLQHGQKLKGGAVGSVESGLRALGFDVQLPAESHLCCGSAGTYSVLQPEVAEALRQRKQGHLDALPADVVASGNIGCISHLAGGSARPVRHWIEVLDEALSSRS